MLLFLIWGKKIQGNNRRDFKEKLTHTEPMWSQMIQCQQIIAEEILCITLARIILCPHNSFDSFNMKPVQYLANSFIDAVTATNSGQVAGYGREKENPVLQSQILNSVYEENKQPL